jgi:hypothetical protein
LSIVYVSGLPPVLTKEAKLTVSSMTFAVDIPEGKIVVPSGRNRARVDRFSLISAWTPNKARSYTAAGATPTVPELLDHEPLGYLRTVGIRFLGGTAQGLHTNLPLLSISNSIRSSSGAARLSDAVA